MSSRQHRASARERLALLSLIGLTGAIAWATYGRLQAPLSPAAHVLVVVIAGSCLRPNWVRALFALQVATVMLTSRRPDYADVLWDPTAVLSTLLTLAVTAYLAVTLSRVRTGGGPAWATNLRRSWLGLIGSYLGALLLVPATTLYGTLPPEVFAPILLYGGMVMPPWHMHRLLSVAAVPAALVYVSRALDRGFDFDLLSYVVIRYLPLLLIAMYALRLARSRKPSNRTTPQEAMSTFIPLQPVTKFLQAHSSELAVGTVVTLVAYGLTFDLESRLADRQLRTENLRFVRERADPASRKPFSDLDLHGTTLSGLSLGCEKAGQPNCADFRRVILEEADLIGADLSYADLSEASVMGADMQEALMTGAQFAGADLTDALLSGAHLGEARLVGAVLANAVLEDTDLRGADLTNADLSGASLLRTKLSGATLDGADLDGADLSETNLRVACYDKSTITWPEGFDAPESKCVA